MDTLQKIRALLKERNWSIYKLAQASGINPSTLSNLFARNNVPTIPTLERICSALGVTLSEFFSVEDTAASHEELTADIIKKLENLTIEQKKFILDMIKHLS